MRTPLLIGISFVFIVAAHAETQFCSRIRALTQEPAVAAAHWGISVTTLTGTPLCSINEAQLFRPASTAKLFTTAAALALLGPQRTVETTVEAEIIKGDTIPGDLRLHGAGDPSLLQSASSLVPCVAACPSAEDALADFADALYNRGIRHIGGNILGDDTLFPFEPIGENWSAGDLLWGYGAPISALPFADNELTVTVTAGASPGAPATANIQSPLPDEPTFPYYDLRVEVVTVSAKAPASVQIERLLGSRTIRIYGTIAVGSSVVEALAIDDPALYAATALKIMLERRGISVAGQALAFHRPPAEPAGLSTQIAEPISVFPENSSNLPHTNLQIAQNLEPRGKALIRHLTLAAHTSPLVLDDVRVTLKTSQNLHAEIMLHTLGLVYGRDGSTAQGARVVHQWLVSIGLLSNDLSLDDGSGLSTHDLTTPRALTQILVFAFKQPWFGGFKAALPVGGVDGTLSTRYTGPELKGKIFAKTGTLGESRALSGYLVTATGRTLVFSILDDNHLPGSNADRTLMDRIVEMIARRN